MITKALFPQAADAWLHSREPYISSKTFHEYKLNIKTLNRFFGEMRLTEITGDQIRAFQRARMSQCGAHSINHECSVLQQMLKRIGRWAEIAADYQPLPVSKAMRGRALRDDERERLFATAIAAAAKDPMSEALVLFMQISINTTAGPKEVLTLRLKDIDLEHRTLTVQPEGAKNAHRIRRIPLNDGAFPAASMALARARKLGASHPDHYLFPFRVGKGDRYDPRRHQTTMKTAWRRLRKEAKLPNFRMYDLRHHAITVLYENPDSSEETVEAIAGHVGRQMKKVYSHVRIERMRTAMAKMFHAVPLQARLRNSDVLELIQAGMPTEIIAAKIKGSKCQFDTSIEAMKALRAASVPDAILLAMVRAAA
jgi:integrase